MGKEIIERNTYAELTCQPKQLRGGAVAVMAPNWECKAMFFPNGVTCLCAEFKTVPSRKLWCPTSLAAQAVAGFGVISPCLAREAIPQLAELTELVLGDKGMSSAARVRRVPCRPLFILFCTTLKPFLTGHYDIRVRPTPPTQRTARTTVT